MKESHRLDELDALRGLAALSVMLYHYTTRYRELFNKQTLNGFEFKYGYLGVEFFFMISGFVIFMTAGKVKTSGEFLLKRFIRLYPAYWICLTLSFVALLIFPLEQRTAGTLTYLVNLTMFQELFKVANVDGVYWSLFVEWMFYIIIAVLLISGLIVKPFIWLGFWLGLSLVNTFIRIPLSESFFNLHYAPYFIAGIGFYKIWQNDPKNWIYWPYVLAAGIVVLFQNVPVPDKIAYWICSGVFILFIYGKLPWIANRVFIWLGAISYSLYLVHQNIGYILLNRLSDVDAPFAIIMTITLILALSHLINSFIEKPLSKWLRGKLLPR